MLGSRDRDHPTANVVGVTWQWVGRPGAPFGYRGSIGPYAISTEERQQIERLGRALALAFGLVGLFGVDVIMRGGQPWPVEVNPRYTASVEVLELALGRALLADHRQACDPDDTTAEPRASASPSAHPRAIVGKVILFAENDFTFPDYPITGLGSSGTFALPDLADIPVPGTCFLPGEPVLTLFAQAESFSACRAALADRLAQWHGRLQGLSLD
jgi:predicted ATP-grasp superfamily ATP-dependent carboligase